MAVTDNLKSKNVAYLLKLPSPPAPLLECLISAAEQIPLDPGGRNYLQEFHHNKVQIVDQVYGKVPLDNDIQMQVKNLYEEYFNCKLYGVVARIENVQKTGFSTLPPHCDRYRRTAINYILQGGGSNVLTDFYKNYRKKSDLSTSENMPYSEVELDFKIRFPERTWVLFDSQRCHGVENVENVRLIFSLLLENEDNIDFQKFISKYRNLIDYDTSLPVL